MKELRALFRPLNRPFPNDSQCKECKYFDITDPRVIQTIREEFPHMVERMVSQAKCRCGDMFHPDKVKQRNLWSESNLPNRYASGIAKTFDNFKQVKGTKEAYGKSMRMASAIGGNILTIIGTYGTGKSHLVEAVAREWLHGNRSVKYEYVPTLMNELRSTVSSDESNGSLWTKLQERFKPKLLILDDLGQENPTEWTRKLLTEIIDERIRTNGWLLCATNYTQEQLKERIDERFVSRLFDRSDFAVMTCDSYPVKQGAE